MSIKKPFVVNSLKKVKIAELLSKGERVDGRKPDEFREVKIETNLLEKSDGSAMVSIGDTKVIAGVKVEIDEPFPDVPDKGVLMVNVEILPLASAYVEPGPPDEEAIELARIVDRGIRESGMVELDKLVLIPGKKVYSVFVDINVVDICGNVIDAAHLASAAALLTTSYKEYVVESGELVPSGRRVKLPTVELPVSVTAAIIKDKILVDPSGDEEALMNARITVSVDSKGNFCAGQKGESGGLTLELIEQFFDIALVKAEELRKKLLEATSYAQA